MPPDKKALPLGPISSNQRNRKWMVMHEAFIALDDDIDEVAILCSFPKRGHRKPPRYAFAWSGSTIVNISLCANFHILLFSLLLMVKRIVTDDIRSVSQRN
ncbi:hypothetical protein EMCG_06957 [[Emmonsia] crescens]|uniref:Uncharacterized protein n=1 Tax=[Emmonsia] crescens TaxID=73230 RepID=A0A0G2J675_9EURO|nr:hypothetical protein EMCG_06957 [Emmonsia crescens UAMH 3008]